MSREFDHLELHGTPREVHIEVNGTRLVDLLREIGRLYAEREGRPELAGSYHGVSRPSALANFSGKHDPQFIQDDGKVTLLVCAGCEAAGCWDFVARIERGHGEVHWRDFEQIHRPLGGGPRAWRYDALGDLVFRAFDYDRELERLEP